MAEKRPEPETVQRTVEPSSPRSELDAVEPHASQTGQASRKRARVLQVQASVAQAETNLEYTRIISPEDGVIISGRSTWDRRCREPVHTYAVLNSQRPHGHADRNVVDEADIARVNEGRDVEFTVDAYTGSTFRGKVRQVRISPATSENVVTYPVIISVANPDLKLKPGMTTNVSIITDRRRRSGVPMAALSSLLPGRIGSEQNRRGDIIPVHSDHAPPRHGIENQSGEETETQAGRNGLHHLDGQGRRPR